MVKLYFFFFLQLFKKLDEGHQKQKEELSQELIEVKVYNNLSLTIWTPEMWPPGIHTIWNAFDLVSRGSLQ